jgi:GNAT superfamily N-acetyltransferase
VATDTATPTISAPPAPPEDQLGAGGTPSIQTAPPATIPDENTSTLIWHHIINKSQKSPAAEKEYNDHAAATEKENADKEALYRDNPAEFKKQNPYEYIYRKTYDYVKDSVEAEPKRALAPGMAKQPVSLGKLGTTTPEKAIDDLTTNGLQDLSLGALSQPGGKPTMMAQPIPLMGRLGEVEPAETGGGLGPVKPVEGPETGFEMSREHVRTLKDLGYSNQAITHFNAGEVQDIIANKTPAPPEAAPAAETKPTAAAEKKPAGKEAVAAPEGAEISPHVTFKTVGGKEVEAPQGIERRDYTTRPFPSGQLTRVGRMADTTFNIIRQHEAEAQGGTVQQPTIKTEGPDWEHLQSAYVGGKKIGSLGYKTDVEGNARIYGAQVTPEMQRKGIATKMYLSAFDKARADGVLSISSDPTHVSPAATGVWRNLQASGLPIENITHPNGTPGFRLNLQPPETPATKNLPDWLKKDPLTTNETHATSVPLIPSPEGTAVGRVDKPDVPVAALSDSMAKVGGKMVAPPTPPKPTVNPETAPIAAVPMPKLERTQIQGGASTQPYPTYHEASNDQTNPWVRRSVDPANSASPTNENRLLMVQFASDLINGGLKTETKDEASQYYDKLYSGFRPGYARMQDFWEIPQWHGFVARNFPDADVYVVRDMEQAKKFLNDAKYGRVTFSALDVNKHLIRDLASNYSGHVDVGGYVAPETFSDLPNVKWHDSMESLTKDAGVEYKGGADYRHYAGSDVIPRLTMSKGCLHKCAFCTVEKQLVMPPKEDIEQQADAIAQLGSKLVYLNDKTFGQAKNYQDLAELNTRMKEKNPNFQGFVVQTTAAQMGKIPADWLAKSGIKYVELGIESYNDPILKSMHKPATENIINKAVDKLRQNNITLIPNILIGYPGETAETYANTLKFLQDNRDIISHANIYNLALYENTELGKSMTTASPDDFNENVLEKSFHKDPALHQQFAGDLYGAASKLLEATPTPLRQPTPEPQFHQALARRGEMPGQTVNLSPAYGETGGYIGGHIKMRLGGATEEEDNQRYAEALGVTHGPSWDDVFPAELLPEGNSPVSVVGHEDGHIVEGERVGWPMKNVVVNSAYHPTTSGGAAASTDFGPVFRELPGVTEIEPGRFKFSAQALKENWPKAVRVYLGGVVSQEVNYGIPIKVTEGGAGAGDAQNIVRWGKAMGLTDDEIGDHMIKTLAELRKDWQDPAINAIVKKMAAEREDGIPRTVLQTQERVDDLLNQVRAVWEGQKHGITEGTHAADGGVVPATEPGAAGGGKKVAAEPVQGRLFAQKGGDTSGLFAKAIKHYGTTEDIRKAGYIGLDGTMLDFSEGQEARTLDHGDIASIPGVQSAHNSNPRFDFVMKTGAMRVIDVPQSKWLGVMVSAEHPPTHAQLDRLTPLLEGGRDVEVDLIHPDWALPGGASAKDVHDMDGLQRVVRDAQKMHAEAQRRIANGKGTENADNGTVGGGFAVHSQADVARGESEVSGAAGQKSPEVAAEVSKTPEVKTAEIQKPPEPWHDQAANTMAKAGGFTIHPTTGKTPTEGYVVEIGPEQRKPEAGAEWPKPAGEPAGTFHPSPQDMQEFHGENKALFDKHPELHIGGYEGALEVSGVTRDKQAAIDLAHKLDQKSIYDIKNKKEIEIGGTGKTRQFPDYPMEQRIKDLGGETGGVISGAMEAKKGATTPIESPTVSTRVPSRTVKGETVEDHTNQSLISDMEAAKAAPGYIDKMVNRVKGVPGFVMPESADAQTAADAYIRHVADNIKFMYRKLTPAEIAYNEQWYPVGAHERGLEVAKTHDITPNQAWAVTSVESPMTDWNQNTALAERTVDIWKNQQNTKFTPEMQKAADEILSVPGMGKFAPLFKSLRGKTLAGLTSMPEKQAWWLRLYDEGHNPRSYQTWGPDGKPLGLAKNVDGSEASVGWSFQNHIQKAISILRDGSPENISKQLGYGHKVRNFYNNQAAPDDPRFLTIDTHAVAAGQLRPLAGKHPDVGSNFGTISNGPHGLSGTYPLHDAAYRLAAKELDIPIPSRLQSPVWAKIREVFTDDFKTKENINAVDAIWRQHNDGKITADEARNQIWDYAARWHDEVAREVRNPADQRELFTAGVRGEPAEGAAGRGDRGGTPVVDQTPETPEVSIFAKPAPKAKGNISLEFLKGGLKKLGK